MRENIGYIPFYLFFSVYRGVIGGLSILVLSDVVCVLLSIFVLSDVVCVLKRIRDRLQYIVKYRNKKCKDSDESVENIVFQKPLLSSNILNRRNEIAIVTPTSLSTVHDRGHSTWSDQASLPNIP